MKLKNKVAVVTGAAVGIGKATAIKLASEGAAVAILDLNEEKLLVTKTEIEKNCGKALAIKCDVSNEEEVGAAFAKIKNELGKTDILVNNAALWRCWAPFIKTPVDDWKKYIDVNVMSVVYCTHAVLPDMISAKYGRIINVASVAGVYGNANMVHYSATKGAVISMTKALAKEVADKGITVNAISPGSVSPSENDDLNFTKPSELSFMNRTGSPMENAELICFLASDEAAYISCQNIQIDGCRRKQ
jgi:NAD(P)-dependent dehydrogenase (short-subunit alcohol dehydrogenase family)